MMSHPCEHLRVEDKRLTKLDMEMEKWVVWKSGEELIVQ